MYAGSLIDTNILVYRFDPRDPEKQRIAREFLLAAHEADTLFVPHQALSEFIAAVTRPRPDLDGKPIMNRETALVRVERMLLQFKIVWPDQHVFRTAFEGFQSGRLSWYDAHLWAHAEANGIPELVSEDFEHGKYYGHVRAVNPFLLAPGGVHELPPMFA
jgi:predicted nucleic acid-binding protein